MYQCVDGGVIVHLNEPSAILNEIPAFAENDHANKEREAGLVAQGADGHKAFRCIK